MKGLFIFITLMWAMILGVSAFLIIFVAPIHFSLFGEKVDRLIISIVQASIAIVILVVLVLGFSKLKKTYVEKKLRF
jgi:hypothetical protein